MGLAQARRYGFCSDQWGVAQKHYISRRLLETLARILLGVTSTRFSHSSTAPDDGIDLAVCVLDVPRGDAAPWQELPSLPAADEGHVSLSCLATFLPCFPRLTFPPFSSLPPKSVRRPSMPGRGPFRLKGAIPTYGAGRGAAGAAYRRGGFTVEGIRSNIDRGIPHTPEETDKIDSQIDTNCSLSLNPYTGRQGKRQGEEDMPTMRIFSRGITHFGHVKCKQRENGQYSATER